MPVISTKMLLTTFVVENYLHLNITRNLVKRPVMTIPYGVKVSGMVDQQAEKAWGTVEVTRGKPYMEAYLYEAKPNTPSNLLHGKLLRLTKGHYLPYLMLSLMF
jgi:hypothetical protein